MKFLLILVLATSLISCAPSATNESNSNTELQTGNLPVQYVPELPSSIFWIDSRKVDVSGCRKGVAYLAQFQANVDSPVECHRAKAQYLYQPVGKAAAMLAFNEYDPSYKELSDDTELVLWPLGEANRIGHAFFEKRGDFVYTTVAYIKR